MTGGVRQNRKFFWEVSQKLVLCLYIVLSIDFISQKYPLFSINVLH